MADSYVDLRPDGTVDAGSWTPTGAATLQAATDDSPDDDATYIDTNTTGPADLLFTTSTIPALAVIKGVQPIVRAKTTSLAVMVSTSVYDGAAAATGPLWTSPILTTSFATYFGPLYTTRPGGTAWTQAALDAVRLLVYHTQYSGISGVTSRVSELWLRVYYNQAPAVTVTGPSGTITSTTQPTVTWTYTDPESNAQERYRIKIFSAAQYGAGGFAAETSTATWDSGSVLSSATSATVGSPLTNGTTYKAYVKAADVGSGGRFGAWDDGATFTITVTDPAVPTLVATADATHARIGLDVRGRDNLLTANQASLETDTTGWAAQANCTISQATPQHLDGSHSLAMTSTGAGELDAATSTGTSGVPVTVGQAYQGLASFQADSTTRSVGVSLSWYDSGGALLSTDAGTTAADVAGPSWQQVGVNAVAPANAAFAAIKARVLGVAGAGEIHYVDNISIAPGSSTTWTRGGLVSTHEAEIERSDDGGTTWAAVSLNYPSSVVWSGALSDPPQNVTVYDYAAPFDTAVQYRARVTASDSGSLLTSAWSSTSSATLSPGVSWLKDPSDASRNMQIGVRPPLQYKRRNRTSVVDTLGAELPIVRSDGPKGEAGSVTVGTIGQAAHDSLDTLIGSARTLLLQIPDGERQRYIAVVSDAATSVLKLTASTNSYRETSFDWVEVAAP